MTRATEDPNLPAQPASPEDSSQPAVQHSGEGADSAMDAMQKQRIDPPQQGGEGEKNA